MSVREHWINVRVNPEELARIREKQKELGIRLSLIHISFTSAKAVLNRNSVPTWMLSTR